MKILTFIIATLLFVASAQSAELYCTDKISAPSTVKIIIGAGYVHIVPIVKPTKKGTEK
jgi:hypothetical protein